MTFTRIYRTVPSVLSVCILLGACTNTSTSAEPSESPSPLAVEASATPAGSDPCGLLAGSDVSALAGEVVDTYEVTMVGDLPACLWGTGSPGVQVAQAPAEEWAAALPALIDQLRTSGAVDAATQARLDDATAQLDAGAVDATAACDLFSLTAEAAGHEPGSTMVVDYVPTREEPQALSAQACVDGVYSTVTLYSSSLMADDATTAAATTALEALVGTGA